MKWANLTDVGMERSSNEDNLLSVRISLGAGDRRLSCDLHVVSDGMGGAAAGEVASALTVTSVARSVFGDLTLSHREPSRNYVNLGGILSSALRLANETVHSQARADLRLMGMGATATALASCQGLATVAQVGDSRCYLWRRGELRQVTQDHSLVAQMVRDGRITPEQARHHPRRNIITRAIGSRPSVDVDVFQERLLPGDLLLLCSDGLSGVVEEDQLSQALSIAAAGTVTLDDVCRSLVEQANSGGGPDNISVIVAQVEPGDASPHALDLVAFDPSQTLSWHEAAQLSIPDHSFEPTEP